MLQKATARALSGSTVTSSHVDWLTVTTKSDDGSEALWQLGNRLCTATEHEGEFPTGWHGHGYRGWHTPGIAFGARADGGYMRLSGAQSAEHWFEALATAENCSRIDLAVDTQLDLPVTSIVDECYGEIPNRARHGGRPPMMRVVKDTRAGQTLYLGARTSTSFGRLYDKGVESKSAAPGLRWRFELEAKQERAQQFAELLKAAACPRSFIQGAVAGFFFDRIGVRLAQIPLASFNKTERDAPTSARLLQWLSIGVRPTVAKLMRVYGRQRVLTALGIPLNSAVDGHD